jgi:UDP-N-acetylmuramyl tripeptide synthase
MVASIRPPASSKTRAKILVIVVVAGKGHETGQEIAGVVHPFSDVDALTEAIRGASR